MKLDHPGPAWQTDWERWLPEFLAGETAVGAEDLAEWLELAPTLPWIWASNYAKSYPHWFLPVEQCDLHAYDYLRYCAVIWRYGQPEKFNQWTNVALRDDEHKWWVTARERQGKPLTYPTIQRATHVTYGEQDAASTVSESDGGSLVELYDSISPTYDYRYATDGCHKENVAIWRLLSETPVGSKSLDLLDIGAGSGLALDLKLTKPKAHLYRAVDPSQGMLNQLISKHSWVKDVRPMTLEDYLVSEPEGRKPRMFDTVVALFSGSYLTPEAVKHLPGLSTRQVFVMHYAEDYWPDYHTPETMPDYAAESREAAASLVDREGWQGRVGRLGNYQYVHLVMEPYAWR